MGASNDGTLFFVNQSNPDMWWHTPEVEVDNNNWEGIAVDTADNSNHVYIIYEGQCAENKPPKLAYVRYLLGRPNIHQGDDNIVDVQSVTDITDLTSGTCKLTESDGLEAFTLYRPSARGIVAEFLVGVQKTGEIYSIDSTGALTNSVYLPADGRSRVSGSEYFPSTDVLVIVGDSDDQIQAIDVSNACVLETWTTRNTNEEGLSIVGDKLYLADDNGGLYVHNFDLASIPSCCSGDCSDQSTPLSNEATVSPSNSGGPPSRLVGMLWWIVIPGLWKAIAIYHG